MFTYDQALFQRQITDYLSMYHQQTKKLETGSQVFKNSYGDILGAVPYLYVELKDDADILADLAKMKHVRVMN